MYFFLSDSQFNTKKCMFEELSEFGTKPCKPALQNDPAPILSLFFNRLPYPVQKPVNN